MPDEQQLVSLVGRIYTHFLYRDLSYVAGGLLAIAIPAYAHGIGDLLVHAPWWALVPVIFAAYGAGLFSQEAAVLLGLFQMFSTRESRVDQELRYLRDAEYIRAAVSADALLRLERIIALKHVTAVAGGASLVSFLLLQVYYVLGRIQLSPFLYGVLTAALPLFSLVMRQRNRTAALVQDRYIQTLREAHQTTNVAP